MKLGDLKLGMSLNLDDPIVISQYKIRNVRSAISNSGRPFKQFVFGPEPIDTEDRHISEGIVNDGVVDSLMKIWVVPYKSEEDLQKVFPMLSMAFSKLYNTHLQALRSRSTRGVHGVDSIGLIYSPSLHNGVKAYPNNMTMAVRHAIIECSQLGQRIMARAIFCEENDLNTAYTLELHPSESKFQLTELITLRN